MLPLDGAAYIFKSHIVMLHLQDKALSDFFVVVAVLKNIFVIGMRGSKQCLFYLRNDKLSTKFVCHDSYYVDMYLKDVQLCVKSRVG